MLKAKIKKHILKFKFDARTSRGTLHEHEAWYILISSGESSVFGIGECSPLKGLSPDYSPESFERQLAHILDEVVSGISLSDGNILDQVRQIVPQELPSIRFGVETALLDLRHGGKRNIFETDFYYNRKSIPINGLIWMGKKIFMVKQAREKIKSGFKCIKIKIGALDFREECEILNYIRIQYSNKKLELRLDANGAFHADDAMEKLEVLKNFNIHSIEQPIKAENPEAMARICAASPVPVALDEELIGHYTLEEKYSLLDKIKPSYIVLKPTLLGGFLQTEEWIIAAEKMGIGWWITSALESNIGLNAIAQFTASHKNIDLPQGLGTGMLYHNNIPSPLNVNKGTLEYDPGKKWELNEIVGRDLLGL